MKFILIFITAMYGSSQNSQFMSVEFNTKNACISAMNDIKYFASKNGDVNLKFAQCYQKGN